MAYTSGLHSALFASHLAAQKLSTTQSGSVSSLALIARGLKIKIQTN
jgi:hypothetical protein